MSAGLLALLVFSLLAINVGVANSAGGNTTGYAWGGNAGWINFNATHGGVTVYSDHLEGYAWGENIGWIRLGTCTGGSPCTYANTTGGDYGLNNDGVGNLSGYAWGTNVGWINFDPTHGGVTLDPVTGDFDGYAWSENVGWIHFQNSSPAYKVNSAWRGDLLAPTYYNGIAAILTTRRPGPASSDGLILTNLSFLNQPGDGILCGHNNAPFAVVYTNLPAGVDKRWARIWQLDVNDQNSNGGEVTLTFDISDAGGDVSDAFSPGGTYFLLKRPTGSSGDFSVVTVTGWSVSGDQLIFTVNANHLGSEFTLGAKAGSPTALSLAEVRASSPQSDKLLAVVSLLGLGLVGSLVIWRRRR